MPLPSVAERFLRYVRVDTQSDPESASTPSTEKQKDLGRLLAGELREMGLPEVEMDEHGYVFATLPGTLPASGHGRFAVALLAHVDTSPDAPGANVRPVVHPDYAGGVIALPGDPAVVLDPARQPELLDHLGHDLITSDGTTLLGSDDKAGVAVLMQLAEDLARDRSTPRPAIRLCFTVDEEIGRGVDRLDLGRLGADVAYTLDGSGVDNLFVETFNAAEATVVVEGVMVHPGYAKGVMVNALRILADLVALLPATESPEATEADEGYFHPHRIRAEDTARAELRLLLRDFTDEGMQRRRALLEHAVASLRLKYPRATITLRVADQYRNMRSYIEQRDPRTISFALEAARRMGFEMRLRSVRGGTDGARLSEMGLPTPNVFTGGHAFHSRFEWNTVQNLEKALAFTKTLVILWGERIMEQPA